MDVVILSVLSGGWFLFPGIVRQLDESYLKRNSKNTVAPITAMDTHWPNISSVGQHRGRLRSGNSEVVVVVTLFPIKYVKHTHTHTYIYIHTHIYLYIYIIYLQLLIPKIIACAVLVSARKKNRGLSRWLPQNVTSNFVAPLPGPARRRWHTGTLMVVSRNQLYPKDLISFDHLFCYELYLDTCHFMKCMLMTSYLHME